VLYDEKYGYFRRSNVAVEKVTLLRGSRCVINEVVDRTAKVMDRTVKIVDRAAEVVDRTVKIVDRAAEVVDRTIKIVDRTAEVVE